MGLSRKKTKGAGIVQPKHRSLLFSDQNDVDNFVDNYGKDGAKVKEVSYELKQKLIQL